MNRKLITAFTAFALLTGCNVTDDTNDAMRNNDNDGAQPTRFENTGTSDGMNDNNRNHTDYRERNRGEGRFNDHTNKKDQNNRNRFDVAEEAAEQITDKIPEIETAYVLTTENNAYVAARMDTNNKKRNQDGRNNRNNNNMRNPRPNGKGHELTDNMKKRIAEIVRSVDNDIDNVFVSTNPDFYNLTTNYVDDVNAGRPIEGFFDQFGNMIERLFPQNR